MELYDGGKKIGTTWIYHGMCRSLIGKDKGKDGEIAGLEGQCVGKLRDKSVWEWNFSRRSVCCDRAQVTGI